MNRPYWVVADYPALEDDVDTCGPGPFSMADEVMVRRQLESAGYVNRPDLPREDFVQRVRRPYRYVGPDASINADARGACTDAVSMGSHRTFAARCWDGRTADGAVVDPGHLCLYRHPV